MPNLTYISGYNDQHVQDVLSGAPVTVYEGWLLKGIDVPKRLSLRVGLWEPSTIMLLNY